MEFNDLNCTSWFENFDGNTNYTYTTDDLSRQINKRNLAAVIFVSAMILVGTIGNVLVILVFTFKFSKSTYRVYVLCLAYLDTVNCCVTMPFVLTYLLFSQNYPSDVLCKFGHFVGFYIGLASPFTLILIAADRYRNICQPLCLQMTEKKAQLSCIIVNIASFTMSWHVPVIYGSTKHEIKGLNLTVTRCFKEDDFLSQNVTWWQYIILTVILFMVTAFLAVTYFFIMIRVHHKSKYFTSLSARRSLDPGRPSTAYVTKNIQTRKTTLTFFIITTVYVLSSFIHHALAMILHVVPNLECHLTFTQGAIFWTFFWTIFINNIANPFIYGLSDERFRHHLKLFFMKKKTTPLAWTTQQHRHLRLQRK